MPVNRPVTAAATTVERPWASPLEFARKLWPYAKRVAAKLGTVPRAVIAQAALETGWGARVMARDDGASSHNFFGIKADSRWSGDSVVRNTIEFRDGEARREAARFRAYSSAAAGFDDYFEFLKQNPRYAGVFGHGEGHRLVCRRAGGRRVRDRPGLRREDRRGRRQRSHARGPERAQVRRPDADGLGAC